MSYLFFELDDPLNPSTLNNLEEKVYLRFAINKKERKDILVLTPYKIRINKIKVIKRQRISQKYGSPYQELLYQQLQRFSQIEYNYKKFISKVNNKKNYTRKDLKVLFSNEQARFICKEYFSSFQIIKDILKSTKISDSEVVLKYVKKLFIGTQDPQSLSSLKYSNYDF